MHPTKQAIFFKPVTLKGWGPHMLVCLSVSQICDHNDYVKVTECKTSLTFQSNIVNVKQGALTSLEAKCTLLKEYCKNA